MALKKTITTVHGFEAKDAYHRVEGLRLEGKTGITFHVRSYAAPDTPFFTEQVLTAPYDLNGDNPLAQAYAHLKTLSEFEGAVEC
jgi:hypothetical protein